jgi:hypothetical protein
MLVWEDGRADFADVYGQNVNPDGSLGVDPAAVAPALAEGLRLAQNAPNPFYSSTRFTLPTKGEVLTLRLTDAGGRVVRLLNSGRSGGIEWDGRDEHGRALPAGTYFFRVMGAGEQGPAGRAILLR